tara:strand:+ start:593 stop:2914 length:2322 start_codon:yes stop_codon:yes gene_type:complete
MIARLLRVLFSIFACCDLFGFVFTNKDGRTLRCDVVSLEDRTVTLKRLSDGYVFQYPLEKLSIKDQRYLTDLVSSGGTDGAHLKASETIFVRPVIKNNRHFNASHRIDAIIERHWDKHAIHAGALVNDEVYLRRAYLRIIGRIPSTAEAVNFLQQKSPHKRSILVDTLLDSTGYVSHQFNFWADLLRIRTVGLEGTQGGGIYYAPWLKEQIAFNTAYDDFVRMLLTAEGYAWDNPAVGYYMRDEGMPLDNMALGVQAFLGIQLQCAQCHDHPFAQWKQRDFYQLAAFTHGIQTEVDLRSSQTGKLNTLLDSGKKAHLQSDIKRLIALHESVTDQSDAVQELVNFGSAKGMFMRPFRWGVTHHETSLMLPDDYAYADGSPGDVVKPKLLFGDEVASNLRHVEDRIQAYADWMTAKEQDRFALMIANRLWRFAMGRGVIEPVDAVDDFSKADNPELMQFLGSLVRYLDYDLKQFLRILYNTQFFQRIAVIDHPDIEDDYRLQGPVLQRMTSEQIWDSFATLMRPDIDPVIPVEYTGQWVETRYNSLRPPPAVELFRDENARRYLDHIQEIAEFYGSYYSVLSKYRITKRQNAKFYTEPRFEALRERFAQAQETWFLLHNPGRKYVQTVPGAKHQSSKRDGLDSQARRQKIMRTMVRASELASPMLDGHLLQVFGQADRHKIDNRTLKGNLLQALFLMNSSEANEYMANDSMPVLEAQYALNVEEQLELIFLGFLSRKPTATEFDLLIDDFRLDPEGAKSHFIWAMLNTKQFLFIQ